MRLHSRPSLVLVALLLDGVCSGVSDEETESQPIRRRQVSKQELDASAKRLALEAVRMASNGLHPVEWALPEPLRGDDGGFSLESVKVRLPAIARTVITNNEGFVPVLVNLVEELAVEISQVTPPPPERAVEDAPKGLAAVGGGEGRLACRAQERRRPR